MPRWLLFTLLAVVSWGLWAVISKLIGDSVTPAQSQALSTIGLIPVMLALGVSRKSNATGNRRRGGFLAFLAGVLTCAGNVAYYHALNIGGKASTVVPLTALYPLVTIALAVLVLQERFNAIQCAGVALSLLAIYLFNVPGVEGAANV
ncbi:MAG: EamA family transporter, partial [Limisphaerales bacterium]